MSSPKEIRYFSCPNGRSLEWYLDHFKTSRTDIVAAGEFASNYLYERGVAKRIRDALGLIQIVAIVRDPVQRTLSHIKHYIRDGRIACLGATVDSTELRRLVGLHPELLTNSLYFKGLCEFRDVFGEDRLLVLDQGDFRTSSAEQLESLYAHLGVESFMPVDILMKDVSPGIVPRWQMLERARILLYAASKRRAPRVIDFVRRIRVGELYRRLNAGQGVSLQDDAVAFIRNAAEADWGRVRAEFLPTGHPRVTE